MLSLNYEISPKNRCFSSEAQSCLPIWHSRKKFRIPLFFQRFSAQIEMVPQNYQKLDSEEHVKLMEKLIDIMEDDDDVQNIWHNWEE